MHTYTNLKKNGAPPLNIMKKAQKVPLVHGIRNFDVKNKKKDLQNFKEIIDTLKLYPSKSSSEKTSHANNVLDIPFGSLFFFAGRAYPAKYGTSFYILIEGFAGEKVSPTNTSKCSPFDSGGIVHGHSKLPWLEQSKIKDADKAKKKYYSLHSEDYPVWREYFALFLSQFFPNTIEYWDNKPPCVPIDEKDFTIIKYTNINDEARKWLDWTFEVWFEEPLILKHKTATYFADNETSNLLQDMVLNNVNAEVLLGRLKRSDKPQEDLEKHILEIISEN